MRSSRMVAGVSACAFVFALAAPRAQAQIDLADIVGGGDGSGTADPLVFGIDPRNGNFVNGLLGGRIAPTDVDDDGVNPSPVAASDLVDSIFFVGPALDLPVGLDPDTFLQPITQSGIEFQFPNLDGIATGWNPTLANRNAGGGEPPFLVGGNTLAGGIGIHSSTGITFDLEAIRTEHGAGNVGCFTTYWGMDGCGGDVVLYAILSDDTEAFEFQSFNATQNSGALLQMEIPSDAEYLTLVTGSNGADGCDHGNFGVARITAGACVAPEPVEIVVTPDTIDLAPGGLAQLAATLIDDLGLGTDITSTATYTSAPAGIVSVSAGGLVTALAVGSTTITVANSGLEATVAISVANPTSIDLGDLAVGGSGIGDADPSNIGINGDTGQLVQARLSAGVPETNFINPMPVDGTDGALDTPFVDSVFIMEFDAMMPINTGGATFDFEVGDVDQGWEAILNAREPGGADFLEFGEGVVFNRGVGVHASQGITYDLEALRDEYGSGLVQYASAVAGELTSERNGAGLVNCYMILSDDSTIIASASFLGAANVGRFLQLEIPDDASYLTLAVGAAGNGIGSDHGGFGLAVVGSEEITPEIASLSVTPNSVSIADGETVELSASALYGGDYAGVQADPSTISLTYESADTGVASVDDAGVVTGEGVGETTITVSGAGLSAEVAVTVFDSSINLADVLAGGDGTGTAPVDVIGIDPRNGQFAFTPIDGTITEADLEGDGLNPSPVDGSDFVDSVFFIGPDMGEGGSMPINLEEVVFDFPVADAIGTGWNHILRDSNGGVLGLPVLVGGVEYQSGLGIHSSMGVTFDLQALRDEHGDEAVGTFSTIWGMDGCGGDVTLYTILSTDAEILGFESFNATVNSGEELTLPLPTNATYLTLATGSNGADGCDHGTFANARILSGGAIECPDEGDTHCEGLTVGDVEGPNLFGLFDFDVTAQASDDSGDPISYTFTVLPADGAPMVIGPQAENTASLSLAAGDYTISVTVDDVSICSDRAADSTCETELCLGAGCDGAGDFVRGDVDSNGQITLTDGVVLLNWLFQGGPMPGCMDAADSDNSGTPLINDAVIVFGWLFNGQPPPVAPSPTATTYPASDCGPDTGESLGCVQPAATCS